MPNFNFAKGQFIRVLAISRAVKSNFPVKGANSSRLYAAPPSVDTMFSGRPTHMEKMKPPDHVQLRLGGPEPDSVSGEVTLCIKRQN